MTALDVGDLAAKSRVNYNDFSRVVIHKKLIEELELRKQKYEKELGYAINGGTPIVSLICARILEKERLNKRDPIQIEFKKIAGKKKNQLIIL